LRHVTKKSLPALDICKETALTCNIGANIIFAAAYNSYLIFSYCLAHNLLPQKQRFADTSPLPSLRTRQKNPCVESRFHSQFCSSRWADGVAEDCGMNHWRTESILT